MVKRYTISLPDPGGYDVKPWKPGLFEAPTEIVRASDYDALAARLAEAERDAARYRWLRDSRPNVVDGVLLDRDGEWDAAIDLAIAASASGAFPTPGPQVCPRCGVVENASCMYSWHQVNAVTVPGAP
jgi:hypothetical protein